MICRCIYIAWEADIDLYADDTTIMASADVNCISDLEESLNIYAPATLELGR